MLSIRRSYMTVSSWLAHSAATIGAVCVRDGQKVPGKTLNFEGLLPRDGTRPGIQSPPV